jgi:hypothetical protein
MLSTPSYARPSTAGSAKSAKRSIASLNHNRNRPSSASSSSIRYETTKERLGQHDLADWSSMVQQPLQETDAGRYYHHLHFEEVMERNDSSNAEEQLQQRQPNICNEILTPQRPIVKQRSRRRVYVPSVGTFDLSSGSESEGETKVSEQPMTVKFAIDEIPENDDADEDDDSVYSLDSACELSTERDVGEKMGRKLSRKETKRHREKLNRGIQRALSQKQ